MEAPGNESFMVLGIKEIWHIISPQSKQHP
jgi:hypothetical protein